MSLINISVCLTDIPKFKIKEAANGKKYINLCLSERREKGKFGETHALYVSQTKDERDHGDETVFVGYGTERHSSVVTAQDIENAPIAGSIDDLPF
jgi:hypothetical protein